MERKNIYLIVILVIAIGGFIFWGLSQSEDSEEILSTDAITYYYSNSCKFCKDVSKFFEENKIEEKVEFEKKETGEANNRSEMQKRAKECGLDTSKIGVPFLYARGECLMGYPEVTDFFKKEVGL